MEMVKRALFVANEGILPKPQFMRYSCGMGRTPGQRRGLSTGQRRSWLLPSFPFFLGTISCKADLFKRQLHH